MAVKENEGEEEGAIERSHREERDEWLARCFGTRYCTQVLIFPLTFRTPAQTNDLLRRRRAALFTERSDKGRAIKRKLKITLRLDKNYL